MLIFTDTLSDNMNKLKASGYEEYQTGIKQNSSTAALLYLHPNKPLGYMLVKLLKPLDGIKEGSYVEAIISKDLLINSGVYNEDTKKVNAVTFYKQPDGNYTLAYKKFPIKKAGIDFNTKLVVNLWGTDNILISDDIIAYNIWKDSDLVFPYNKYHGVSIENNVLTIRDVIRSNSNIQRLKLMGYDIDIQGECCVTATKQFPNEIQAKQAYDSYKAEFYGKFNRDIKENVDFNKVFNDLM